MMKTSSALVLTLVFVSLQKPLQQLDLNAVLLQNLAHL